MGEQNNFESKCALQNFNLGTDICLIDATFVLKTKREAFVLLSSACLQ